MGDILSITGNCRWRITYNKRHALENILMAICNNSKTLEAPHSESTKWWLSMSRTKRLRGALVEYLAEEGPANTSEIFDHINSRFRWGSTMNQLGNVLARDARFIKSGFDENQLAGGYRLRVCIWELADGVAA